MALASPGSAWNEVFSLVWNRGVKGQSSLMGLSLAASQKLRGFTKFTQLHVVTSQFVMFIPSALRARIEDGTGSRHVNWKKLSIKSLVR